MSLLRRISNLLSRVRIDREIAAGRRAHIDLRIAVMVMCERSRSSAADSASAFLPPSSHHVCCRASPLD